MSASPSSVSLIEATKFWFKLGLISFGGPAGQIAIMRQELVEKRRWISEARFLHALNYCMLLPGPEAQQLATYIGWLMHKKRGGLIAGGLFVLPGALLMMVLAWAYLRFGNTSLMQGILWGIKPAVLAIVALAVYRIASKTLNHLAWWAISMMAFICIAVLRIDFPWVVLGAAIAGWAVGKFFPTAVSGGHGVAKSAVNAGVTAIISDDSPTPPHAQFSLAGTLITAACFIALGLLVYSLLPNQPLKNMAQFFTKAALITFGGAYAVLPYVTQASVDQYQWLSTNQVMDGMALGETTPGPLILILTFIGFLGGVKQSVNGFLAASVVTFYTFLPSFMMIFAGAPFIESTRKSMKLQAPLTGISAAVVGVIASLALFFAQHVFWPQGFAGVFSWAQAVLTMLAFVALVQLKRGIIETIAVGTVLGFVSSFF